MKTVTFKIEEDLLALLDRYAMNRGLYRSEVIRQAIIEFLSVRGVKVNG